MKTCTACGRTLPLEEFQRYYQDRPDFRRSQCRKCVNAQRRERVRRRRAERPKPPRERRPYPLDEALCRPIEHIMEELSVGDLCRLLGIGRSTASLLRNRPWEFVDHEQGLGPVDDALYAHRAARLLLEGASPAEAKAEATALALAFKAAFEDGTLIDLGEVSSADGDFTKSALLSLREVIGQDGPVLGLRKEAGGGYEQLKLS